MDIDISQAKLLRLQSGDRLVITCEQPLTPKQMDTLRLQIDQFAPGVPCVVLGAGMTLDVLRDEYSNG